MRGQDGGCSGFAAGSSGQFEVGKRHVAVRLRKKNRVTERGEALLNDIAVTIQPERCTAPAPEVAPRTVPDAGPWHVLWTRSHSERIVQDQLAGKGFEIFLPEIDVWSRRAGQRHLIRRPLFEGYLFLRHPLDKAASPCLLRLLSRFGCLLLLLLDSPLLCWLRRWTHHPPAANAD